MNYFFFSGNRATDQEVAQYLANSKVEFFTVSKWLSKGEEQYTVALHRGSNSAFLDWLTFYDPRFKKYFNLYMFTYLEDNKQGSMRLGIAEYIEKEIKFKATVNQEQLKNPFYGTKENPVPIWPKDIIEYNGRIRNSDSDYYKRFHLSSEAQQIFIGQYLSRFMPKEEFKEMFKK